MTLVEFLHPLRGQPIREYCLAVLLYERMNNSINALTVKDIRTRLVQARAPRAAKANLASHLSQATPYVHIAESKGGSYLWSLTQTGEKRIRDFLKLSDGAASKIHDVRSLESLITSISDEDVSEYISEALKCMSAGALRATVVFIWQGAVREIQKKVFSYGVTTVNAAVNRHDPKSRQIKKLDDFAYIRESTLLLVAQDLGIYDKPQRGTLEEALNLRNNCGHPGKYKPGANKVRSFIEDVVNIVFS